LLASYGYTLEPQTKNVPTESNQQSSISNSDTAKALGVDKLVSEQVKEIQTQVNTQNNSLQQQSIRNISGVWRWESGTVQMSQEQNQVSFIQYNVLGVVVTRAQGVLTDSQFDFEFANEVLGIQGRGQLVINPEGNMLSGYYNESTTGASWQVNFYR
jgi:hypothetical protein